MTIQEIATRCYAAISSSRKPVTIMEIVKATGLTKSDAHKGVRVLMADGELYHFLDDTTNSWSVR